MPSSPSAAQTAAFARVSRRAATRVRAGHPWIYRSDLADERPLPRGEVVQVQDERGKALGWALSSSSSQIALRMIADSRAEQIQLASLIAERIRQAVDYRERLGIPEMSNAYRVVFSEADRLPGLIVDRYDGVLAFQVLTQSMDREDVRAAILDTLQERLKPAGIVERVESRIRELEELPPISGGLVRGKKAEAVMEMKTAVGAPALRFIYDGASGQKTGAFLDQRENYAAAARYARGAALDVFCYQGGFALHLARSCPQVSGVDSSRPALEAAERNFDLNRDILAASEIEWMEANAFDLLRDWSDAGRKFGSIVLDPPAFAKTKRSLPTALRGYKELNLRALKMLEPGGIL
ncbi:MAG: class I SAM-dependent rRNA methyltransferase, partial [Acidobacteria bacterium]|nr:class I SAM-dependent rRNA methyltransferase [Acidobacteriota bacterium]